MTPPAISSSPALSTNLTCVHPEQSACTLYVAEMFACAFAGAFESDEAKKKLTCDNAEIFNTTSWKPMGEALDACTPTSASTVSTVSATAAGILAIVALANL